MASKSILGDIGNGLKKFFGIVIGAAKVAQPIVAVLFPGVSSLYSVIVNEVANVETAAVAAGMQSGSGAQKLAAVLASPAVQAEFAAIEKALGVPTLSVEEQTAFINAVVASLNALPAKS